VKSQIKSDAFLGVTYTDLFGFLPGLTSEQRCGVMPQPKPICATITPIIERIVEALASIDEIKTCASPHRHECLIQSIETALSPIELELEDMRNKCADLRKWGESWKRRTKLEMDLNSLRNVEVTNKEPTWTLKQPENSHPTPGF